MMLSLMLLIPLAHHGDTLLAQDYVKMLGADFVEQAAWREERADTPESSRTIGLSF